MNAEISQTRRFTRRTQLAPYEYRKNFHQIDDEIIAAVTSVEADRITPLMSKIYLRLINANAQYWERDGVLRFEAEEREAGQVKAWAVLCVVVGVASATAHKALTWMHDTGIIGYYAGKNGVGIRIFLNRATSSIGTRAASGGQKILTFAPASSGERHTSSNETAFKDSFAVPEVLDSDLNPHAPKNGADIKAEDKKVLDPAPPFNTHSHTERTGREVETLAHGPSTASVDQIVMRLKNELEPCMRNAATQAATQTVAREVARTREWFETKALPKAVRVAQHETYDLLRKLGTLDERREHARADLQVGRTTDSYASPEAVLLTSEGITEVAETCVALLETQGKRIDVTLAEISSGGGGWLLPEDAPKVHKEAERLLRAKSERR